jgi:hypothetical protein
LDSAGYGIVANCSEESTELLLVTKGSRFPYPELIVRLYNIIYEIDQQDATV